MKGIRVPGAHQSVFANIRNRRAQRGKNLSLHARARVVMNKRRSALRAKQWHGGKQYVGRHRLYHKKKA